MIESSFFCQSSWDTESFPPDFSASASLLGFEDCINFTSSKSSNDFSCNSSDVEDLVFNDLDGFPVTDTFISQILEDSDSTGFNELDWMPLNENSDHVAFTEANTPPKITSKRRKANYLLSSKLWSKMSPEEQLQTLHALSEIVTCYMGIREQIEVIKIIDPSVTISAEDKEFALDYSCLNDTKLKQIRDFVKKQGFCLANFSKKNATSPSTLPSSSSSKLFRKSNSRTKRRQRKQKSENLNEDVCQKRKLELHGLKEAESGLFVHEKIIKKLSNPLEEDEYVNILE